MSDFSAGVFFQREKTALEFQAEVDAGVENVQRFKRLGETMMVEIPAVGEIVFINGERLQVIDRAWSLKLPKHPGRPNFDDPQVMVTLSQFVETRSQVVKDFFE